MADDGSCEECGAAIAAGATCRDHFHELLLLESRIAGGPSGPAHFYAVASYGLQHPRGMDYTAAAFDGLREAVRDHLEGRATMEMIRQRVRSGTKAAGRVTRRPGDAPVRPGMTRWGMIVTDILGVEETAEAYGDRVTKWARSIIEALDAANPDRP
jgi:hypothetical protein